MGSKFARLWTASTISNLGDGIVFAAFPLIVASITRDPIAVSVFAFSLRLPWLVLALPAGVVADRFDRRWLMIGADVSRVAILGLLGLVLVGGDPPLAALYAVGFLLGAAETVFDSSAEAFLPALVEPDRLNHANGQLVGARWVANSFVGPPLGALLFVVGTALPVFVDGLTFAIAAVLVLSIDGTYVADGSRAGSFRDDVREGITWLWRQRLLRTLALMAGFYNLVVFGMVAILVLFVQDEVGLGNVGYGLILSALGVGGFLGGFLADWYVERFGEGSALILTILIAATAATTMGFTSSALVVGAMIFLFGIATTLWNVVAISLRQELTPDPLRGRVAAASKMIAYGAEPIGALVGGLVAAWVGLRGPMLVAGAGLALMVMVVLPIVNETQVEAARARAGENP